MQSNNYLSDKVFKSYLTAGFLSVAAILIGPLITRIIVGNFLSPGDLAAVNLTEPIQRLMNTLATLLSSGAIVMVSYDLSMVDDKSASGVFSFSVFTSILIGLAIALAAPFCHGWLSSVLCDNDELLQSVKGYLRIIMLSAPLMLALPVLSSFIGIDGSPTYSYKVILTSLLVSVVALLAMVMWGHPDISQIALANLAGNAAGCILGVWYFCRRSIHLKFSFKTIDWRRAGEILKLGSPESLSPLLDTVLVFVTNAMVLKLYGASGADVIAVCLSMVYFFSLIIGGFMMALKPYGSYLVGMEDIDGYSKFFGKSLLLQQLTITIVLIPMMVFSDRIMALFGVSSPEALALSESAFPVFVFHYFLCGFIELYNTNFLILKKTAGCYAISIFSVVFRLLFIILFSRMAASLFWWSYPLGYVLDIVLLVAGLFILKSRGKNASLLTGASFTEAKSCVVFSIQCTVADLKHKLSPICEYVSQMSISEYARNRTEHCVEEVLLNTVLFADMRHKEEHTTDVKIIERDQSLTLIFYDDGVRYNPFDNMVPEVDMGLEMIKKMCPDISYTYLFRQNIIKITLPIEQ